MEQKSNLAQLIRLLKQEIDLYRSMQIIIDREKEAAIGSDLNILNETGTEKESILAELQNAANKRGQLLASMADQLGYAVEDLTLSKISQLVDEPHAGNLRRISDSFISVLAQLHTANQRNKQIFEHSLALLRGSFNLLNQSLSPKTVYYRTGNIPSTTSTGKCVCSEI